MADVATAPTTEKLAALKVSEEVKQAPASPTPQSPAPADNNSSSPQPPTSFKDAFKAFSKFGDLKSDGRQITLSQSDKWMKQARVIDGKKITTTDTGIHFKKLKALKVGVEDYLKFIDDLAKSKKIEVSEIKTKMTSCGQPGISSATITSKAAATVDRLTDTSKYTGSHKQRFDEAGKGKGIAGRKDLQDNSGYVAGYQHKDTYDKSH